MKSEYFKYGVLDMFCSEHYKNIITDNHQTELKTFNIKIDKDDIYTVKGWVVKKNRRRYLIKDNIGNENLLNILPIKIVESKEFEIEMMFIIFQQPMVLQDSNTCRRNNDCK
jgi:hypothetical protein